MYRITLLGLALGTFLGASLFITRTGRAWENPPVRIDAKFDFRFNVQFDPPPCGIPKAPWFSYFPYDPTQQQSESGTSQYPDWPKTFPPKDEGEEQTSRYPVWPTNGFGSEDSSGRVAQAQPGQAQPMSPPSGQPFAAPPRDVGFQLTSASTTRAYRPAMPVYYRPYYPAPTYPYYGGMYPGYRR